MNEIIKPVCYGILVGLFGLVFGICWAFYLVLGHERIHKSLEERAVKSQERHSLIQLLEPATANAHSGEGHEEHMSGMQDMGGENQHGATKEMATHSMDEHDNPVMAMAHQRLTRGHIHSMGLGLVTIVIALILAFTSAPGKIKIIAPVLTGIGGLIYPFAWIVMGYRTPSLGPGPAEVSVTMIAGPGIALVLLGIFTAGLFLLKDLFIKKNA